MFSCRYENDVLIDAVRNSCNISSKFINLFKLIIELDRVLKLIRCSFVANLRFALISYCIRIWVIFETPKSNLLVNHLRLFSV